MQAIGKSNTETELKFTCADCKVEFPFASMMLDDGGKPKCGRCYLANIPNCDVESLKHDGSWQPPVQGLRETAELTVPNHGMALGELVYANGRPYKIIQVFDTNRVFIMRIGWFDEKWMKFVNWWNRKIVEQS